MSSSDEEYSAWVDYFVWIIWGTGSVVADILYYNESVSHKEFVSSASGATLEFGSLMHFAALLGVFGFSIKNVITCPIGWLGRLFFLYHAFRAAHHVLLRLELYAGIVESQFLLATLVVLDIVLVALFWARVRAFDRGTASHTS